MKIEIEISGENDVAHCDCCGHASRTVWGLISEDGALTGCYYVHWSPGYLDALPKINVIFGEWGEGSAVGARSLVSLRYKPGNDGGFMVVDAQQRDAGTLAGQVLTREEVVGKPLAARIFRWLDVVWLSDDRLTELTGLSGMR